MVIKLVTALSAVFCLAVLAIVLARFAFREEHYDEASARKEALSLLTKAGGIDKVCLEADRCFKQYGTNLKFLEPADLKDYPALSVIAKLEHLHAIMPGNPPYIEVRVGTHSKGLGIEIIDTNGASKFPISTNAIVLNPGILVYP